jgi:hypothetical protein
VDSEDKSQWEQAINEELKALEGKRTWQLTTLPPGRKPVKCKWVFKKKIGADGSVTRYKARLVAKGFSQQRGIDFNEVFSPVANVKTVRTVLALAAQHNLELHQRTKHIDIRHHYIRERVEEQNIVLTYTPTDRMIADILTKPITATKFGILRDQLLSFNVSKWPTQ